MQKTLLIMAVAVVASTNGKSFKPKTSSEFQSAINDASEGDEIELLPQDYKGDFVLPSKPSSSDPITIKGTNSPDHKKSTKIFASKKAFSISGDNWIIKSLSIESGGIGVEIMGSNNALKSLSISQVDKGVIINGNNNLLDALSIRGGSQAIFLKGSKNVIKSVSCSEISAKGFGIIVDSGSDETEIESTSITKSGRNVRSVLFKEGSSGGRVESLSLDGIVEVKGDHYEFRSSTINYALNVFGCGNTFDSGTIANLFVTKNCDNTFESSNTIRNRKDSPITE